ncbi:MAG: preQ(1) synthase [bacterium]|jgi:7-cyano-7-deazaguanine reductase|nr:preQ(1) synthase [bacterium]
MEQRTGYTGDHARRGGREDLALPELAVWPNQYEDRDYWIEIETPEFTCRCPKTGQPDFARLTLRYVPGPSCVELKSLKEYLQAFRDVGIFHENVANRIHDDLARALAPRRLEVCTVFLPRGGITTTVRAGS